jgi:hypothetical protein
MPPCRINEKKRTSFHSRIKGASHNTYGLILWLNHDGMNDLAGVGKQEKYMAEGTERLDHDGINANNRNVSIRLTDMATLS